MKSIAMLAAVATLTAAPFAFSADPAEHDQHHPASASTTPVPAKAVKPKTTLKAADPQVEQMDAQMKVMRDMHEKMMAAKTPVERNALKTEHMNSMQAGMSTMNGMMAGDKAANLVPRPMPNMHKQMEMMQVMMQMMMDQMGTLSPAK